MLPLHLSDLRPESAVRTTQYESFSCAGIDLSSTNNLTVIARIISFVLLLYSCDLLCLNVLCRIIRRKEGFKIIRQIRQMNICNVLHGSIQSFHLLAIRSYIRTLAVSFSTFPCLLLFLSIFFVTHF
jgi:hypothetical protein